MGEKLVSICITIFMLIICTSIILIINVVTSSTIQDVSYNTDRVSYDNEAVNKNELVVSGSSLISSMVGIYQINNRSSEENKIYQISTAKGITQMYTFRFESLSSESNGNGINSNGNIIKEINPSLKYKITYLDNIDPTENTKTITVNIEEYKD